MSTDYSEFIARNHKPKKGIDSGGKEHRGFFRLAIMLPLFVLYVILMMLIVHLARIDHATIVISVAVFIAASLVAFFARRAQIMQANQEKELQLLREILEGSRGGRIIVDAHNRTLYCNKRFLKMVPMQTDHASGSDMLYQMFSGHVQSSALLDNLSDKAHRGLTESIELYCAQKDYEGWYEITVQPVSGHAGYIHWRIDNVTDRYVEQRTIREEREKLIDFTENAPVGFFSADENGRFVFANATFARWLGVDIKALLDGGTIHTYLIDPPQGVRPFDISDHGGDQQIVDVALKGVSGQPFLVSVNQSVVHHDDGAVRTRAIVHDISVEFEMRKALQRSEDRFERFYDEAPLGIVLVNKDGLIENCNIAFAHMVRKSVSELEQKHFKLLIGDSVRDAVLSALKDMEETGHVVEFMDVSLVDKDGNNVNVQLHARRFSDDGSFVLHFIDMTEKKSLEAQFVQSQKMQAVGQLAGGIAHDFNNLLTAIIGFCDLLLLRHKPGDSSFADIMQIKQNSNRASNLVRQLLAFSRQQTLRQRVHDMSEILTELSHLLRRLIGASIEMDIVHGRNLGLVKIDEGQIEQVLINLAVNARDAMHSGGTLTIETDNFVNDTPIAVIQEEMPPGEWVMIKVSDTGSGIAPEHMERILEPFFTTKKVGEGTGLGLATVYGIIRQSDGYLNIQSEVNHGTVFTIYLPRVEHEEEDIVEEVQQEDVPKDLTGASCILLVEDEDAVRAFSERALANKGYQVLSAENGDTALDLFKSEKGRDIELVITDVVMPGMDGPTLVEEIRKDNSAIKIIFMSGYTEDKLKDQLGDNVHFLPKPFTLKLLAEKVKEVLG